MKSPKVPLGEKCILFSGDFRQILPVVPRGSRAAIVYMTLKSSPLLRHLRLFKLAKNMRLKLLETDACANEHVLQYPEYLLQVVGGRIRQNQESEIELPSCVKFVPASTDLVESVFPNLEKYYVDVDWHTSRAILCPTNSRPASLNVEVAKRFPGSFSLYRSADSVSC